MAEPGVQRSKSYNDIDEQRARINRRIFDTVKDRKMSFSEAERRYNAVNRVANRYLANITRGNDYQQASLDVSLGRIDNETAYQRMYKRQYLRKDYARRNNRK